MFKQYQTAKICIFRLKPDFQSRYIYFSNLLNFPFFVTAQFAKEITQFVTVFRISWIFRFCNRTICKRNHAIRDSDFCILSPTDR